ncbi:bifunctional hydroxymethylpyrimidine kinase/phosphomethylpyrimidine kinase [Mediterranea massiliensis]|uniref:bifunctional hydroxymethylpyrimidine kinase/phosphomethylpyrimidine kinase n=1 Tax=Mediterranea massiliensis TaxID=1841865 RepID=UPI0025A42A1A|nr:bifunctional hydroxymethylpyrimidine kinase/phosphomethylpyrimidine kinase [Mediterranea massiliensis]MDM8339080.1 bifunctional hydroxymethylpyrimidine kinase/phosphomethylpyrimidine kinase [Mediterranea massiliensis]
MEQLTRHLHELLVAAAPRHPSVLSIAGSDCSGGAGIQADIKAISALGGYAASAITAVTSQNTLGVQGIFPLPPEVVEGQIRSVMDDLHVRAVKIGMVHDAALVRAIAGCLRRYSPAAVVCDPVMISTSGHRLMAEDTIRSIEQELFPLSTLITPNLHEASMLCGRELHTVEEMKEEAMRLSERYGTSVLIKGGHLEGEQMCDVLASAVRPGTTECFVSPRIDSHNLHGTGCTLSSAIATRLAFGFGLEEAIGQAKEYMDGAIRRGRDLHVGHGHGPLWHFQE